MSVSPSAFLGFMRTKTKAYVCPSGCYITYALIESALVKPVWRALCPTCWLDMECFSRAEAWQRCLEIQDKQRRDHGYSREENAREL